MRNKISSKIYYYILLEAAVFLLVAFAFLPRTVILVETALIVALLVFLTPKARL